MQRPRHPAHRASPSIRISGPKRTVVGASFRLQPGMPMIGTLPTPQQIYGEIPFSVKFVRTGPTG
jgi:hypothetical protein